MPNGCSQELCSSKIVIDPPFFVLSVKVGTISVGLFATKEQEMEQRAMLLKRLSFVIFSSEKEHYEKYMQQILGWFSCSLFVMSFSLSVAI